MPARSVGSERFSRTRGDLHQDTSRGHEFFEEASSVQNPKWSLRHTLTWDVLKWSPCSTCSSLRHMLFPKLFGLQSSIFFTTNLPIKFFCAWQWTPDKWTESLKCFLGWFFLYGLLQYTGKSEFKLAYLQRSTLWCCSAPGSTEAFRKMQLNYRKKGQRTSPTQLQE